MNGVKVYVEFASREQEYLFDAGQTFAQNLFAYGLFTDRSLCSGLGLCGQCKIKFISNPPEPEAKDLQAISPQELDRGYRLACIRFPEPNQKIEIPPTKNHFSFSKKSQSPPQCLAIDLGTTTIKWAVIHADKQTSKGQCLNPQMGAGAEVVSRLAFALESEGNKRLLTGLLQDRIRQIAREAGGDNYPLVVAGNPAMIYLLLGLEVRELSFAPFNLNYWGGCEELLDSDMPRLYIPPLLGAFVGADISAGLAYLKFKLDSVSGASGVSSVSEDDYPYLFCDLGTNGEMVLVKDSQIFLCTSVAMGPALEGVGLRFGSVFGNSPDVCSRFFLTPSGLNGWSKRSFRITGSGYLSLISILLKLGVLDSSGHFREGRHPLARKVLAGLEENRLYLTKEVYLSAHDIEEILKVKAAFNLAVNYLLEKAGMKFGDLRRIFIAGALGQHVQEGSLEDLGFLPQGTEPKISFVGNTSLKGSVLLCQDKKARSWVEGLKSRVQYINLAEGDYLAENFAKHMRFSFVS
ncbi:ASKHA domain-containing protein [Desulfovulcanus sp.]